MQMKFTHSLSKHYKLGELQCLINTTVKRLCRETIQGIADKARCLLFNDSSKNFELAVGYRAML